MPDKPSFSFFAASGFVLIVIISHNCEKSTKKIKKCDFVRILMSNAETKAKK